MRNARFRGVLRNCVKIGRSHARNARFGSLLREIWRKSTTKPSFSRRWGALLAFCRVAESRV